MRRYIIIIFLFLIYKVPFAQPLFSNQNSLVNTSLIKSKVDSLNNKAHSSYLTSPESAHKIAVNALILAEKSNYSFGKGVSFYNIGLTYWSQSYYAISLYYLKSALLCLPKNKPLNLSDAYNALGRTYAELKSYKLALKYLDTSLYYAGKDPGRLAEVLSTKSYVYAALSDFNKAIAVANYSLKLNKIIKAEGNIAVLYGRLGSIYLSKKNYAAAKAYNDTALNLSIKINNRHLRAYSYLDFANICNQTGKFDNAIKYAQKAITLSDSIGVMDAITKSYNILVNSYELKNDLKEALYYQKRYNLIRDSLGTIARLKTIKLVQNYYDLNSKINHVQLMEINDGINKSKIKSQRIVIFILILSLLAGIVILLATYYFYKEKQLLSNKLQQQHASLLEQKQLIELQAVDLKLVNGLKDKLLAVIGHDLRTPVANLSNIIEMFEDEYLTAGDVHDLMKDINPIIKGAELTLSNLVEWAGSQIKGRSVEVSSVDIFLLGVEMEQTFLHALQLKKIEFINNAYAGHGVLADENHLKVILRNLISNAIKFTDIEGTITISTVIKNIELIISVADTGKGMTRDEVDKLFCLNTHFSNSGTLGEKGTGIGLILCNELVELNGGKLMVKSVVDSGSIFYFNLPLKKLTHKIDRDIS
ncbi:MAG: cph1 6 [Mucilaginibacter sp.]|nr:cph1 6 [Mucilaginibacter sp.]